MSDTPHDLTDDQLRAELAERVNYLSETDLRQRIGELEGYGRPSRLQRVEYELARDRLAHRQRINQLAEMQSRGGGETIANDLAGYGGHRPDPARRARATTAIPPDQLRDRARALVDDHHRAELVPDRGAEALERLLTDGPQFERDATAQYVTAVGSEHYRSAFETYLRNPTFAHLIWTEPERDAFARVSSRALSLSGGADVAVPLALDPAIILTGDGSTNPIRQLARVRTISVSTWDGVSSQGVVSHWYPEAGEVTDDAPTLTQPSIPTQRQSSFVPFSIESGQDWATLQAEMRRLLLDSADQLDAAAFVDGAGAASNEPVGVVTGLVSDASTVYTLTSTGVVLADVDGLQEAIPPRFRTRAAFAGALGTIHQLQTLVRFTNSPNSIVSGELDPYRMSGWTLREASEMATTGTNATILVAGDWSGYTVVERLGATIELVPHLFGTTNNRPTGQRGLFMWRRVGADVTNPAALRALVLAT